MTLSNSSSSIIKSMEHSAEGGGEIIINGNLIKNMKLRGGH